MRILKLAVGMFQSNCFVAYCEESREAVIIDPGDEAERIVSVVEGESLRVLSIVNTHAHIDHVSGLPGVVERFRAPVLLHEEDAFLYESLAYQGNLFGLEPPKGVEIDRFLSGGEEITFGEEKLEVVHTPGHSPGSMSLLCNGSRPWKIFSGDTLFRGSIGRTDLYGGSYDQIVDSLRRVFLELPDDTVVYPGHGETTTMAEEKVHNPFLVQLLR